jgi:DNA-binding beta-propeller fold protein YncE
MTSTYKSFEDGPEPVELLNPSLDSKSSDNSSSCPGVNRRFVCLAFLSTSVSIVVIVVIGYLLYRTDVERAYVIDTEWQLDYAAAPFTFEKCSTALVLDNALYVGQGSTTNGSPFFSKWDLATGAYISSMSIDASANLLSIHTVTYSEVHRRFYFVDQADDAIKMFDEAGLFMGATDSIVGLSAPTGAVLDFANDYLYVTDGEGTNNRIVVLTWDLQYVDDFGSFGTELGQFDLPHGIMRDFDETSFWVADQGNGRIQIFRTSDTGEITFEEVTGCGVVHPNGVAFSPDIASDHEDEVIRFISELADEDAGTEACVRVIYQTESSNGDCNFQTVTLENGFPHAVVTDRSTSDAFVVDSFNPTLCVQKLIQTREADYFV